MIDEMFISDVSEDEEEDGGEVNLQQHFCQH
jgi:hypothetical protein